MSWIGIHVYWPISPATLYRDAKAEYNAGKELSVTWNETAENQPEPGESAWRPKVIELAWKLLIGTVAGGIARYALPGRNPGGLVVSVMVGLAGSFLAAYVGERFGWYREGEVDGIIMCGVGATVVLAIFRFLSRTSEKSGGRENYDL